jgi:hypothetical protein
MRHFHSRTRNQKHKKTDAWNQQEFHRYLQSGQGKLPA